MLSAISKMNRSQLRPMLIVIFAMIFIASFIWSIIVLLGFKRVYISTTWNIYWFNIDLLESLGFLGIVITLIKEKYHYLNFCLGFTVAVLLEDLVLDIFSSYNHADFSNSIFFGIVEIFFASALFIFSILLKKNQLEKIPHGDA